MPSFGHLLTAGARPSAGKRRIWEVILESDVHDSLADRTCRLCGVWQYSSESAFCYHCSKDLFPGDERRSVGVTVMRNWCVLLFLIASAGSAASGRPSAEAVAQSDSDGRSLFLACEFKRAARAFERALSAQPDSAALYYWLGKSYARLADVSSPLSAPKNARRARHNLEEAVKRDPQNHEYLVELFDFYLDSPEWFHGGLQQAETLLELTRSAESDPELWLKEIADSRGEHSGPGWCMRRAVLWTSGAIGRIIPGP